MELKPSRGRRGDAGSWLTAAVQLRQLTQTVNLRKHQQEVAAATCRLFMLTPSLVCLRDSFPRWKITSKKYFKKQADPIR